MSLELAEEDQQPWWTFETVGGASSVIVVISIFALSHSCNLPDEKFVCICCCKPSLTIDFHQLLQARHLTLGHLLSTAAPEQPVIPSTTSL